MLISKITELSNQFEKLASKELLEKVEHDKLTDAYCVSFYFKNKKYQAKVLRDNNDDFHVSNVFKVIGDSFLDQNEFDWQLNLKKQKVENLPDRLRRKLFGDSPSNTMDVLLEDPDPKYISTLEDKAIQVLESNLNHKTSIASRKEIFLLISQGGIWDTVTEIAGGIGGGLENLGKKVVKKVEDFLESDEEKKRKADAAKEEAAKKQQDDIKKQEERAQRDAEGDQIFRQFESQHASAKSGPEPPESLKKILSGYVQAKDGEVPQAVVSASKNHLSTPMWSTKTVEHGGVHYLLVHCWHHDDHVGGILKWHPGVTVYKPSDGVGKEIIDTLGSDSYIEPGANHELEDSVIDTTSLPSNEAAAVLAFRDIGIKETGPVKNSGPEISNYFKSIGINLPPNEGLDWCAAATSHWLKAAGCPVSGSASVMQLRNNFESAERLVKPYLLEDDENKDNYLTRGNVVFWSRGGGKGHVGILLSYDKGSNKITTIDGNSGRTGKEVAEMTRNLDNPGGGLTFAGIGLV